MRIATAFRAFFAALGNGDTADAFDEVMAGKSPAPAALPEPKPQAPPKPARSEAITLLATLQREARLVDIVQEPLDAYSDAQVGAAARDVLRDCGQALQRLFAIEPAVEAAEGDDIEAPAGFDAAAYKLSGNVTGEPPFRGKLVHHGWKATKCQLPQWSGSDQAANTIAPIEIEL